MRPPESFIGQPIRSLQTMLRFIAEDDPRHMTLVPDGIYGPETTAAVSRFQQLHGLPVTGITDQPTWEMILSIYEPAFVSQAESPPLEIILNPGQVIRKGEKHPHIYIVQGILHVLSQRYESIPSPGTDGILDEATADALASFQYLSALPMTGNLDKNTWKHLAAQYTLAANPDGNTRTSEKENIAFDIPR